MLYFSFTSDDSGTGGGYQVLVNALECPDFAYDVGPFSEVRFSPVGIYYLPFMIRTFFFIEVVLDIIKKVLHYPGLFFFWGGGRMGGGWGFMMQNY